MNKNIDVSQLSEIELKIFKLKDEGHSYRVIADKLSNDISKISYESVRKYCNAIYAKLGIEEPKTIRKKPKTKIDGYEKEIYSLKEDGMSIDKIRQKLKSHDVIVCARTISSLFKKDTNNNLINYSNAALRIRKVMPDDEIFSLLEHGNSYSDIVKLINMRGVKTSYNTIKRISERIYSDKGLDNSVSYGKRIKRINIPVEEMIKLKNNGLSYVEIADFFTAHGTKVSPYTIFDRCRKYEDECSTTLPKNKPGRKKASEVNKLKLHSKNYLRREILKLGEKKKASQEQLQLFAKKISEIYGEEINIDSYFKNDKEYEER